MVNMYSKYWILRENFVVAAGWHTKLPPTTVAETNGRHVVSVVVTDRNAKHGHLSGGPCLFTVFSVESVRSGW